MAAPVFGLTLSLLLVGASIELQVGTMRTVSLETATALIEHVAVELEARGHGVTVRASGSTLAPSERIAERLGIEVVGGVTVLRFVVERFWVGPDGAGIAQSRIERDLPRDEWQAPLSQLLAEMFGERLRATSKVASSGLLDQVESTSLEERKNRASWPLWISGAGIAALGVGVGFGILNRTGISRVESEGLYNPQGAMLLDSAQTEADLANTLLISGGVLAVGGLLVYLLQGD